MRIRRLARRSLPLTELFSASGRWNAPNKRPPASQWEPTPNGAPEGVPESEEDAKSNANAAQSQAEETGKNTGEVDASLLAEMSKWIQETPSENFGKLKQEPMQASTTPVAEQDAAAGTPSGVRIRRVKFDQQLVQHPRSRGLTQRVQGDNKFLIRRHSVGRDRATQKARTPGLLAAQAYFQERSARKAQDETAWSGKGIELEYDGVKYLTLSFQGEERFAFDVAFLRDSCRCARCVDPSTNQKLFNTADIPLNIRPRKIRRDRAEKYVCLTWENDIKGYKERHETRIRWMFLRRYIQLTLAKNRHETTFPVHWDRKDMELDVRWIGYEEYMTQDRELFWALRQLRERGLLFVKNVPEEVESVERIGRRIGPLMNTLYGMTWDVRSVPNPTNIAYTHQELGLHQDLLYFHSPPALQLLHCMKNSVKGGESIFADAHRAVHRLRRDRKLIYDSIHDFPVSYQYRPRGPRPGRKVQAAVDATAATADTAVAAFDPESSALDAQDNFEQGASVGDSEHEEFESQQQALEPGLIDPQGRRPFSPSQDAQEIKQALNAGMVVAGTEHYHHIRPLIELLPYSLDMPTSPRISCLNWSPPFQAPYEHSIGGKLDKKDRFRKYLEGIQYLNGVLNDPNAVFQHRLEPGQCVIMNNRRIVHGRKAFDIDHGERWLRGAYLGVDAFDSAWRVLAGRVLSGEIPQSGKSELGVDEI
ncbi:MAG: hypothetical protein M1823_006049 [Watsoniomyces obsoletus]|nr:MAG: hypothetical protein M1823_006049 [Watsoniomyces obsoletus]